jgi:Flp pilus assembly protein protease CpaA
MPKSLKIVLGVVLGFVVWFGVATVGNLLIRQSMAGYAEAEPAMRSTTHCGRSFLFGITPSSWPPLRRSSSSAQRCHGRSRV